MDDVLAWDAAERLFRHEEEEENEEVENSIADDFVSYDCFMQPFDSPDEGDEQTKGLEMERFDQIDKSNSDHKRNANGDENRETNDNLPEDLLNEKNLTAREKSYRRHFIKLERLVVEKIEEVEEVTAEKDELERSVQTALQKLWAKEEELHCHRASSFEREKCCIENLTQECARSEELETQVQTLTNQKDMLQEQVFQLEQQLLMVKGETEKRKKELDLKLPELESTQESLKKMTAGLMGQIVDAMSVHNKQKSRVVDVSTSTTEENSSDLSSSEHYNENGESLEDDLSAEVKMINLKEQYHDLRKEVKSLISSIHDLWYEVNPNGNSCNVGKQMEEVDPRILLSEILQAFCKEKSMVTDLNEQNARQLKHLQEVQEAHCLAEGRVHRLWIKFCVHEERKDLQKTRTKGTPETTEERDDVLQKIETALSKNKSTLEESQELKRLNVSQGKKMGDLKALVEKLREEHRQLSKELEWKSAKLEESRLSTRKTIEDKEVEIEILKEQLQESEKHEEQLKRESETGNKCTDDALENLLQSKERAFEAYKRKYQKEEMALRDEIRDLREALERASRNKNDLQEYCELLKDDAEKSEILINSAEEDERSLKELLEQEKKNGQKLYLAAKELYDEIHTKSHEALSQSTTITVLQEKVRTLELELRTTVQDWQVDKKNLRNTKETERYLQSSLQQALKELFQLKTKNEEETDEGRKDLITTGAPDEAGHQKALQQQLHELENLLQTSLAKCCQDLEEYAARIEELSNENKLLEKEVDEYRKSSLALQRTNHNLKTLLRAVKDDLLEEIKTKKSLEVLMVKSNEKTEPSLRDVGGFHAESTKSLCHLPSVDEAQLSSDHLDFPSNSSLRSHSRVSNVKRRLSRAISKRFSLPSVSVTSPRKEKKAGQIPETKKSLEVLMVKSNERADPSLRDVRVFHAESTKSLSHLPSVDEAQLSSDHLDFPSNSSLRSHSRVSNVKGRLSRAISKRFSLPSVSLTSPRKEKKAGQIPETTDQRTSLQTTVIERRRDLHEASKMAEREERLRDILMAMQRDKEKLEQEVETLNDELQKTKMGLQNYENLKKSLSEQINRNVHESLEMRKALESIYGKTRRVHTTINKDLRRLLENLKEKDKRVRKFEWTSEKVEKENADLVKTVAALKEQLENEVVLKEIAFDEGRQLRESLQTILESKEKRLLLYEPPLLINNLNADMILPQFGKEEVRAILKEVLGEIECSKSEEISSLRQKSVEQMEELASIRKDNKYLRNLVDVGAQEELQRAEERIAYLNGKLKISQERQETLRETAIKDRVQVNQEVERLHERYAELKIIIKGKEAALERCEEIEEVLINENTQLQKEIEALKERFVVDGLSPITQKAETKRALEGWKRKCQRLQESFDRDNNHLQEENSWLHKQLLEESSLCEELRRCNTGLDESLKCAEEKVKEMHQKLEERQEALAYLEERRIVLETKIACLQKVNDDLQSELSKERSEAERNLMELKNEYTATSRDLKRQQQEGNNLVTKVFLLENAKEKLEQELAEKERNMMISLESFTEERSRLSEKVRNLRISLEEEVRRRLDLEEKIQQIVKISVMEKEKNRMKATVELEESLDQDAKANPRGVFNTERNTARPKSISVMDPIFNSDDLESTGQQMSTDDSPE